MVGPTDEVNTLFSSFSSLDEVAQFTQDGSSYGSYDCSSPP